jgi:Xaa-Pro aminopeptidase
VAGDLYAAGLSVAAATPNAENFMGPPGYNTKFIGHGIGIEVDEFPFVAKGSGTILAQGMVFALEPKFVFPEEGAVGLENTYLVTADGFETLTPLDENVLRCDG